MNSENNLEEEIRYRHFMKYLDFCEIKLLNQPDEDGICYRCKKPLEPLTYIEPEFYYQPCWSCVGKRRMDRQMLTEGMLRAMKEFYTRVTNDRYLQLFLVDDIYFNTTFPHTYSIFKRVVNSLEPPSRNDIWFLDWNPGYPKIINLENLPGLKIVNLTELYEPIILEKERTKVGDYEIFLPEPSNFDPRHHSRYSLLNTSSDSRKSKRFKIGDTCVKLYNTENENVKALFKITKNGEEITIRNIPRQDFVIIKLAIMRNKAFMRFIFDVILEISKYVGMVRDTVFLKNTVVLDPSANNSRSEIRPGATIVWTALSKYVDPNLINISIL